MSELNHRFDIARRELSFYTRHPVLGILRAPVDATCPLCQGDSKGDGDYIDGRCPMCRGWRFVTHSELDEWE